MLYSLGVYAYKQVHRWIVAQDNVWVPTDSFEAFLIGVRNLNSALVWPTSTGTRNFVDKQAEAKIESIRLQEDFLTISRKPSIFWSRFNYPAII
jgi:hypothetical protein